MAAKSMTLRQQMRSQRSDVLQPRHARRASHLAHGGAARAAAPKSEAEQRESDEGSIERLRLHNLSPQPGARRKRKRVGRGFSAGQGGSSGRGMRGQKQRTGQSIPGGFEGGQNPLQSRLPKLKGIGGGMPQGKQNYVCVNLGQLQAAVDAGRLDLSDGEVGKREVERAGIAKFTGKERRLPLKILGGGELSQSATIAASSFSAEARRKIEDAGGSIRVVPLRRKWTRHGKQVVGYEAKMQEQEAGREEDDSASSE